MSRKWTDLFGVDPHYGLSESDENERLLRQARDLACAYEAQLAKVRALAATWMARLPHQSGAFYAEAHAYDSGLDTAYEACADELREALDVPDE